MPHKRVKLGLFVVGTIALAVAAAIIFAGLRLWGERDHYRIHFDRSVSGLSEGARVERWGIQIGTVTSISFTGDPQAPILVEIAVESGTRIPVGAKAKTEIEGLTWSKYINLVGGDVGGPSLEPGAVIEASDDAGLEDIIDRAADLIPRAEGVFDKLGGVADNVLEVTGERNRIRIASMLDHADHTAGTAAETADDLHRFASELRERSQGLLDTLSRAGDRVDDASESARAAMEDVRLAARDLRDTAADLATIGHSAGRQINSVFSQLHSAASDVRALVRTLESNPARLLRGKSPGEREIP